MKTVKVLAHQTMLDIAIQEYGDVSAAFLIAQANDLSPTAKLGTGAELLLPDVVVNREMETYCKNNRVSPATSESAESEIRLRIFTEQFTKEFM